eukprot:gene27548-33275_t
MPQITRKLLRKRAEHNEGMISTLEEISLHQEELESINEVLGKTCRKLKILYLQNNIIPKMENLYHMKDLRYLNLALNNITKIEGLDNCEFLNKLDLTVNFIDFDTLKESIEHLAGRVNLEELYMMGNPAQANWGENKFNNYVIAKVPQLRTLDGTEISKSMKIIARQHLPALETELASLAAEVRTKKLLKAAEDEAKQAGDGKKKVKGGRVVELTDGVTVEDIEEDEENEDYDPNEMTENTPEVRVKIYQELAQQKKEKEDRANANLPKERDHEAEHIEFKESIRAKEQSAGEEEVKQKNEGGWDFRWDEESKPGYVCLEVGVPKHLDSSLIDVDVHPTYVSIIVKSKLLRLRLPCEVQASSGRCQRSKTTGALMVIMPKVNAKDNEVTIRGDKRHREANAKSTVATAGKGGARSGGKTGDSDGRVKYKEGKGMSLQEQLLLEAQASSSPSISEQLRNIVPRKETEIVEKEMEKGHGVVGVREIEEEENTKWITELD